MQVSLAVSVLPTPETYNWLINFFLGVLRWQAAFVFGLRFHQQYKQNPPFYRFSSALRQFFTVKFRFPQIFPSFFHFFHHFIVIHFSQQIARKEGKSSSYRLRKSDQHGMEQAGRQGNTSQPKLHGSATMERVNRN